MKITIFGATGSLGRECLQQAVAEGHEVTVLVRSPAKLPEDLKKQIIVVEGNGLDAADVSKAMAASPDAVLFAVGVDRNSPEDLCTNVTKNIISAMSDSRHCKLIWCGGGSTFVEEDQITFGAKVVEKIARTFMALRHFDKEHQYQLLQQHPEVDWIGVRPLQMRRGPKLGIYRLGFDTFSGRSKISFADCAHAMLKMLHDDRWLRKAPIIQY